MSDSRSRGSWNYGVEHLRTYPPHDDKGAKEPSNMLKPWVLIFNLNERFKWGSDKEQVKLG